MRESIASTENDQGNDPDADMSELRQVTRPAERRSGEHENGTTAP
ncbi:hypothetical protein ABZ865_22845 [Streptomyces sp. NPDC047085]